MSQRFTKQEKLKSQKLIQSLFKDGKSAKGFPVIAVYRPIDESSITKAGFSVSAKRFKKAVIRNKLKRRMREAYRLNKSLFAIKGYAIMFIYSGIEVLPFSQIEGGVVKALQKIKDENEIV